jgi:hypothetical protein
MNNLGGWSVLAGLLTLAWTLGPWGLLIVAALAALFSRP